MGHALIAASDTRSITRTVRACIHTKICVFGEKGILQRSLSANPLMKSSIHPEYHTNVVVTCVCGNTFTTGSTQPEIRTELCSACHPFYTGKQKLVDTARRVEKFQVRQVAAGVRCAVGSAWSKS